MSSDRVMRWHLLLEEYGVTRKYIPGESNKIADMISRHPVLDTKPSIVNTEVFTLTEVEKDEIFPLELKSLAEYQQ